MDVAFFALKCTRIDWVKTPAPLQECLTIRYTDCWLALFLFVPGSSKTSPSSVFSLLSKTLGSAVPKHFRSADTFLILSIFRDPHPMLWPGNVEGWALSRRRERGLYNISLLGHWPPPSSLQERAAECWGIPSLQRAQGLSFPLPLSSGMQKGRGDVN